MNITFTHIVINDDEEVFVGGYIMDADAARDVYELVEYAEENGLRTLEIEAEWCYYCDENEAEGLESERADDEELDFIREHWGNDRTFDNTVETLEQRTYSVVILVRRIMMKIKDKKPIITAALRALGVQVRSLEITPDNDTIGNVFVNGEFFGVFDYVKRAFVD